MLTNKEGFNIPLMHSCMNWTATNPLCTNPEKWFPLFTSSVSGEKTHTNKRNSQTHTVAWLILNKETLCHISQQKKTVFVSSLQTGEYNKLFKFRSSGQIQKNAHFIRYVQIQEKNKTCCFHRDRLAPAPSHYALTNHPAFCCANLSLGSASYGSDDFQEKTSSSFCWSGSEKETKIVYHAS